MADIRLKGLSVEETAGAGITARRAVAIVGGVALHADNANDAYRGKVRGVALESVSNGQTVKVRTYGPLRWAGGSWDPGGLIYVGAGGVLTQVRPASGWVFILGRADSSTKLFIDPREEYLDKTYRHEQLVAASVWTIDHNLGKRPCVQVFDSAGDECFGEIEHVSESQISITFSAAFGGVALCN